MRRETYRMDAAGARALLERAPVMRFATTTPDGDPVLRTVHGVVVDDAVCFHGAPAGEKAGTVGRPAVLAADEIIAQIPSYFIDPERACPATTYYLSAQVHGRLEPVDDPEAKARVLAALMAKFQPEGGHAPLDAADPRYRSAVRGLLIVRVPLTTLDGKGKLGQNRKPDELAHILERLWQRGLPGDPRAIELVRAANPDTPTPPFLRAPAGAELSCALDAGALDQAVALLRGAYWNDGIPDAAIARAHLGSTAWVGAHADGRLVATARAVSDGGKCAWIYDVAIAPAWQGKGLGSAVMRLLLDHPQVRGVARAIRLSTRDAQPFYQRLGFIAAADEPRPRHSDMVRLPTAIQD